MLVNTWGHIGNFYYYDLFTVLTFNEDYNFFLLCFNISMSYPPLTTSVVLYGTRLRIPIRVRTVKPPFVILNEDL